MVLWEVRNDPLWSVFFEFFWQFYEFLFILHVSTIILLGIGFGLIYLPAVVCVGYYFETKRSLATGIAVCGSGFGTFAFAPLATMLLEAYSWKGANLILAGLILNCAVSKQWNHSLLLAALIVQGTQSFRLIEMTSRISDKKNRWFLGIRCHDETSGISESFLC